MPKIIFEANEKNLIPEHLVTQAQEVEGKWVLDAQGVLNKNRELLSDNSTLKTENDRLKTKETEVTSLTSELANKNVEISRLSNEVTTLQSKSVPTGYVAVSKKESDVLKTLKEKNLEVDKISEILTNFETVQKENSEFKLDRDANDLAEVVGCKNVKALKRLIKQDGVTPIIEEVEENGNKVKKGFLAKQIDADKTEKTPYDDYKRANWAEFLPSLEQTHQHGNTIDPPPFGAPGNTEEAKIAQEQQARTTHSFF